MLAAGPDCSSHARQLPQFGVVIVGSNLQHLNVQLLTFFSVLEEKVNLSNGHHLEVIKADREEGQLEVIKAGP
jgi:hypothetical protein